MSTPPNYKTIRDDFFSQPLHPVENVSLMGSRCEDCGEFFLGELVACQNCQGTRLSRLPLSRQGVLFSYTVVRNKPPGAYKSAVDPFQPYPVGLVELPEGIRVLSVLDCPIESLKIGTPLSLSVYPLYEDGDGRPVLAYRFKPSAVEHAA